MLRFPQHNGLDNSVTAYQSVTLRHRRVSACSLARSTVILTGGSAEMLRFPQHDGMDNSVAAYQSVTLRHRRVSACSLARSTVTLTGGSAEMLHLCSA